MTKRHQNVVAAYVVVQKNGKLLLSLRKNTGYRDGQYSLIAGHLEPGETFTRTILREAKEEVGIELNPQKLEIKHIQHCKSDNDSSERVHIYFVATGWKGKISNKEPDKCADLKWFDLNKLPRNVVPHTHAALLKMKNNILYSEHGW